MTTTTTSDPNLPIPAGATAGEWDSIDNETGLLVRSLVWSEHDTGRVGVNVDGFQDASGAVTRGVSIYDVPEGDSLTAIEARELAAALVEAANAMDALQ
ncbi:hypothetical protein [Mycobacterium conspicuum]|jgi:hypothetical protein|uniref:Uncharacterized protein n=1 Tax=Mycobacterium conspicuum TaxID=44010 RepID=A0A1X1SZF3_9MYCO|nr:hypothetical protein [Mycobacterium conspicuum]ORV37264.1 hypothetical protein AWC00_23145 [Mycobacterium conspicuum]BBZ38741.1 hypothetical protein MCNS_18040 [Mycobacterium conspicuum]